jgi:flagellar hook-basal body complex protein FliE
VGETQNLHEVMIRLEEARHSFQLLVQVRNRLLEAYQEVMRMSI